MSETTDDDVVEIENTWINLSDGTRLAARIWIPADALSRPVPAILEYLPYRKRDGTAVRDALTHPFFAAHGYACVRVDVRGYGESTGLIYDEYVKSEQDDGLEVIDWITAQSWCDGNVGMMGISWGGFNGLQIAARQPEALKAIITLCSTDDRYADDIHYKGGNMLMDNIGWAATLFSYSTVPPDPVLVGDDWLDIWTHRLENIPLLIKEWMAHQSRDALWQHGSICEEYAAIKAAVYCITGWADAYTNSIPRMMQHLECPRKALVGPWLHKYPHFAVPEPKIGFLQEALRWWDYWLKGIDTGIMDEPSCTFYLQDSIEPRPNYHHRSGQWIQCDHWPDTEKTGVQRWSLTGHGMQPGCQPLDAELKISSPLTCGVHAGKFLPLWLGPDFPTDQRRDDALSLCFDTDVLQEDLKILGNPVLRLNVSSDKSCGQLTARLSDIAPDGQVTRVTYGTLNLNNRNAQEVGQAVKAGDTYAIDVQMDFIAQIIPRGHRMRIALSDSYFPLLWTAPEKTAIALLPSVQTLELPLYAGGTIENPFQPAQTAAAEPVTIFRQPSNQRRICEDVASGMTRVEIEDDFGCMRFDRHGMCVDHIAREQYCAHPEDPDKTSASTHWVRKTYRDGWQVTSETAMNIHCDRDNFYIEASLTATHGDIVVCEKTWNETIARRSV